MRSTRFLYVTWFIASVFFGIGLLLPVEVGLRVVSLSLLVAGAMSFLTLGGRGRISVTGLAALLYGLLGGAGSILASEASGVGEAPLRTAVALVGVFAMVTVIVGGHRERSGGQDSSRSLPSRLGLIGLALLVLSALGMALGEIANELSRPLFAGAVPALTLAILAKWDRQRWARSALYFGLLFAAIYGYYALVFTGFGRLILVGHLLSVLLAVNWYRPAAWHKVSLLVAVVPVVALGGLSRVGLSRSTTSLDAVMTSGEGLGSFYSPIALLARILSEPTPWDSLDLGGTLVATMVYWVPSSLWDGKPDALGRELAEFFTPRAVRVGHSLAAMDVGEWFINFGWFCLLMAIPMGMFLAKLDGWSRASRPSHVLAAVVLASGLGTLIWGGTFAYVARYLIGALAVAGLTRAFADEGKGVSETQAAAAVAGSRVRGAS